LDNNQPAPQPPVQTTITGKQTAFGLNYDGSVDHGDNGQGFFNNPATGQSYNTRDPQLAGASVPLAVLKNTVGSPYDPAIKQAISSGQYQVQASINGKTWKVPIVDYGPAASTGNALDLTPAAAKLFGVNDNSLASYQIVDQKGNPVPVKGDTGVNPTPDLSGPKNASFYNSKATQDYMSARQQNSFGIPIATPNQVEKIDYYLSKGGDPSQLTTQEKLGYAVSKKPDFLLQPENKDLFKKYAWDQLKNQNYGQEAGQAVGQIGNALGAMGQDLGKFAQTGADVMAAGAKKLFYTFAPGDPVVKDQVDEKLGSSLATTNTAAAQGVAQAATMAEGIAGTAANITGNLLQKLPFLSDDQRKSIDDNTAGNVQDALLKQYQASSAANGFYKQVAGVYSMIPGFQKVGQSMANDTPDQQAVQGGAMLYNPLNFIPMGAGAKVASEAVRPAFTAAVLKAGENLAQARAESLLARTSFAVPDVAKEIGSAAAQDAATSTAYNAVRQEMSAAAPIVRATSLAEQDAQQSFGKILANQAAQQKIGTVNQLAMAASQAGGEALNAVTKAGEVYNGIPQWMSKMLTKGNPSATGGVEEALQLGAISLMEKGIGLAGAGGVLGAVKAAPAIRDAISPIFNALGDEGVQATTTIPFLQKVAQRTGGLPGWLTQTVDPIISTVSAAGKGALVGAATGAAIGGASNIQNNAGGAVQGAVAGGLLGAAGGGFGQVVKYQSKGQMLSELYGDYNNFQKVLTSSDLKNFSKFNVPDQVMMSTFAHAYPGARFEFFHDAAGPASYNKVSESGGPLIGINSAKPDVAPALMAHEIAATSAVHGNTSDILDHFLGDPASGKIGRYTLLDSSGKPSIDPVTGRYQPNKEFNDLKNQYLQGMETAGNKIPALSDKEFANSLFAQQGARYLLSGQHILDSKNGFITSLLPKNAIKTMLMKMGMGFDSNGTPIRDAGILPMLGENHLVKNALKNYSTRSILDRANDLGDVVDRHVTPKDLSSNPNILHTYMDNSAHVIWKNGKPSYDQSGNLMLRTNGQAQKHMKEISSAITDQITALPESQRNALVSATLPGEKGGKRYILKDITPFVSALDKPDVNPNIAKSIRTIQGVMNNASPESGNMLGFQYNKAGLNGKRGAFELSDRRAIPYAWEASDRGTLNAISLNEEKGVSNYVKMSNGQPYRNLFNTVEDYRQSQRQVFQNYSENKPGETGVGADKLAAIHAMWGLQTNAWKNANPLTAQIPNRVKPVINSFTVGQMNNLMPSKDYVPFKGEETYRKMEAMK
jgi:hypothetical protein